MSEVLEKVLGVKQLAIFPLPTVLLPYELLPLHIFEERYRAMLKDIGLEKNLFGLSYFDPQKSAADKPEIGSIGCAAEVREVQPLPDGRSNILTIGLIRYRLVRYVETVEPYLVGEIEFFEDIEEKQTGIRTLADEVFALFKRVAKAAHKLSGQQTEFPDMPKAQPEQLSFLVSAAFNLENSLKYEILEMRSTVGRLEKLKEILDKTVNRVEESAEIHKIAQSNGHSNKKINL